MSRYPPPDFRGPRDRSRSPPRFDNRRQSAASVNFDRRPGPAASDAPRGPRSQLDAPPRPPLVGGIGSSSNARPGFNSLRDAPPLSSVERGRSFRDQRDRDWDRRERIPSPRERSPPRTFKDTREFPPRDLEVGRGRRGSRDGPLSAGSNFSDNPPFAPPSSRGGYFPRGRGRGDFSYRGGRGGRPPLDDRDLFRRERSPPPARWDSRDVSRDDREPERRERFDRRDDERRPSEWLEREREADRFRRDQPPPRLESRASADSLASANASHQSAQAPPINPARLALIEGSGSDAGSRRPSVQQEPVPARDARRDQPESLSYLNGRAETTANRYASRGSSPPTQAPPVPAFTLSFASSAPMQSQAPPAPSQPTPPSQKALEPSERNYNAADSDAPMRDAERPAEERKPDPPAEAPTAPKAPPPAPRAQMINAPVAAPRAPRAYENEASVPAGSRLQGVRSLDNLAGQNAPPSSGPARMEAPLPPPRPSSTTMSPRHQSSLPTLVQPVSPRAPRNDFAAPTGPRAVRGPPSQPSVSPRPPFASPRSDFGAFSGHPGQNRNQTPPPPTAPSGPRNKSFSVSPKVESSAIPTAPKAERAPPTAPRSLERGPVPPHRPADRLGAPPQWAPPSAPRGGAQWNQWRRSGAPPQNDKVVPAKRDVLGDEKARSIESSQAGFPQGRNAGSFSHSDNGSRPLSAGRVAHVAGQRPPEINPDKQAPRKQSSGVAGHSAARSFFGQPTVEDAEEDTGMSDAVQEGSLSTSEESESDLEEDLALFNAKFERQKRQLEAQMVDLSTRPYRATTPLESIARLSRISVRDMQRFNEQREHEMDVDAPPALHNRQVHHRPSHSSSSGDGPDVATPKGGDDHRVAIRGSDESSDSQMRRTRRATPEPVSLPYLIKDSRTSLHESEALKEGASRFEESKADVLAALEDQLMQEQDAAQDGDDGFLDEFARWREDCQEFDHFAEEQERLERHVSQEPRPEVEPVAVAPINPIAEGASRRLHKFSSEYEFELALKQSEETARVEQERQEREAKKNLADMEKEAKLPYQRKLGEIRRNVFVDTNTLRNPETLSAVYSYVPPVDTFTESEQQIFIAAFKETPKKWGEIASLLPGRSYKDCIHHYYTNKWDGRFRDTRAKKYKGVVRRGRGGRGGRGRMGGIMADLPVGNDQGPEAMSEKGRPRRAAAPTTFAEKEAEAKANLAGPSPAKKPGPLPKAESNGEAGSEKPGKRQKRNGDKPGRKTKGAQPLAQLAPQASPAKQYLPMPGMQTQEDMARQQKLEEASLLTGFHGGHHGMMNAEAPMVYTQEGFVQPMPMPEDSDRPKASAPPVKQSASSYWSVPEQNDFVKYIGHFGRDFAAIAAHMGTKTQTMIKNHYQRQIDGGSRPELERSAMIAEERRNRGEDLGPPPQPTPIVKRKYDNPQPPAQQRPLAPHTDAMDVDEPSPAARAPVPVPKHASPPQYQPQPRFNTSAQSTPIQAPRVAQSPLTTTSTPVPSTMATSVHGRQMHHPLGQRLTFLSDTRPEQRPPSRQDPVMRATQETPPRSQPSQPSRNGPPNAQDPQYIRDLREEQERALRMQTQYSQQDRIEQIHRSVSAHRNSQQGSPLNQPIHQPPERKPMVEEQRAPTPPRYPVSVLGRPLLGQSAFGQLGSQPFSSITGRGFNPSPAKREEPRPGSVPTVSALPQQSAPPPEPKRSNVMSLLNSEPEESKPAKRDSAPSVPQRIASPAAQGHGHSSMPNQPGLPAPRRDLSFGHSHTSMPQSQFQRSSFGQPGSAPGSVPPPPLKHENSGSSAPAQQPKQDWTTGLTGLRQAPSPAPQLEREVRPYFSHHHRTSLLGSLSQARANPSPPPGGSASHSRQSSLTQPLPREPPLEQLRPGLTSQQSGSQQPSHSLAPNPYGGQQGAPFSQQPSSQSQNHAHHAHNTSINSPFPTLHHRSLSRDDQIREERLRQQEQVLRDRQREREEPDLRWRMQQQQQEQEQQMEAERRREEQILAQRRREEDDRRAMQQRNGPPPMPLQPPTFSGASAFGRPGNLDLRGQSRIEAEMAVREQEERERQQNDRRQAIMREREFQQSEIENRRRMDEQRRQEEALFRRTPLGGGYGPPPPPPGGPQGQPRR